MPRFLIASANDEKQTGTVDACFSCGSIFRAGKEPPAGVVDIMMDKGYAENNFVVKRQVAHPSYDEDYAECCLCGEKLTEFHDK